MLYRPDGWRGPPLSSRPCNQAVRSNRRPAYCPAERRQAQRASIFAAGYARGPNEVTAAVSDIWPMAETTHHLQGPGGPLDPITARGWIGSLRLRAGRFLAPQAIDRRLRASP